MHEKRHFAANKVEYHYIKTMKRNIKVIYISYICRKIENITDNCLLWILIKTI